MIEKLLSFIQKKPQVDTGNRAYKPCNKLRYRQRLELSCEGVEGGVKHEDFRIPCKRQVPGM